MTPRPDNTRRRSGSDHDLIHDLQRMDGRPYGTYKSVTGDWDYGDFTLSIDRVQSDPYAPPSSIRATTTPKAMGLPAEALTDGASRLAAADFLVRSFEAAIRRRSSGGTVRIAHPGQEILQRSAATVQPDHVEIRFQVQMPARGRSILGRRAAELFDVDVPNIVMDTFDFVSEDPETTLARGALLAHIAAYEDHRALQDALVANNWVAFIADGSILARKSGISQLPMDPDRAIAFEAPESLRATVDLNHWINLKNSIYFCFDFALSASRLRDDSIRLTPEKGADA